MDSILSRTEHRVLHLSKSLLLMRSSFFLPIVNMVIRRGGRALFVLFFFLFFAIVILHCRRHNTEVQQRTDKRRKSTLRCFCSTNFVLKTYNTDFPGTRVHIKWLRDKKNPRACHYYRPAKYKDQNWLEHNKEIREQPLREEVNWWILFNFRGSKILLKTSNFLY